MKYVIGFVVVDIVAGLIAMAMSTPMIPDKLSFRTSHEFVDAKLVRSTEERK